MGTPSAKWGNRKMGKSYIKITVLICVLIMVATALGGILFTLIMINDANSDFVSKVTGNNEDEISVSRIEIEKNEDTQKTLIVFDGYRFLKGRSSPDIGHYGRYVYQNDTPFGATRYDPQNQVRFSIEVDGNKYIDTDSPTLLAPNSSVYITDVTGSVASYSIDVESDKVIVITSPTIDVILDDTAPQSDITEETEKQSELDGEAKALYDELIDRYSQAGNATVLETGLMTSRALVMGADSFSLPMVENQIDIYEYDAYIFHPMAYVFSNYMHIYIVFIVALVALILLTILVMRRMYVNRKSYEIRTRNLTRSFAHELKTPLAVTQLYVDNWELVDDKEREEAAVKISGEVDHMNKMITTLLSLSAMDSGDVKLNLERVELFEFAKACYERLDYLAHERGIKFEFKKETDEELYVMADLDMMNMVISNFLSNAIKYGKEKAVVSVSSSGSNVVFKIMNDGDTISAKELKKIWDLFYKQDKARTDRMGSNGVGLAVNKSILELHKAKFGAESRAGETSFWFEMKKAK